MRGSDKCDWGAGMSANEPDIAKALLDAISRELALKYELQKTRNYADKYLTILLDQERRLERFERKRAKKRYIRLANSRHDVLRAKVSDARIQEIFETRADWLARKWHDLVIESLRDGERLPLP